MSNFLTVALKRLVSPSLALLTAIVLTPCAANATPYIVKLVQQGTNVVATGSGAIELTGLTSNGVYGSGGGLWASDAFVLTGAPVSLNGYTGFTGPTSFGSGGLSGFTTGTGSSVGIFGSASYYGFPVIWVPQGYVSDMALTSGAIWDSASFASLGVTPGTYTWTWGTGADQSFTMEAVKAVPEPAVFGMFGLGVLLIGGFTTLRRRDQQW